MKAIIRTHYGGPEGLFLGELPRPQARPREVLVKVYATTVSRTDCGVLTGQPKILRLFTGWPKPRNRVPGTDFAGQIEALGSGVRDYQVGDRVFGFNDIGLSSAAEYLTVRENSGMTKIPDRFSYAEAVACVEGAHYAYNYIDRMHLQADSKVLVNGATGAIGSAAVQLLKYEGVYVTAVGNTKNKALLLSLGVDKFWDYEKEDFTRDEERYDYILDAVGKSTFGQCKTLLQPTGVYMSSELGPGGENLYLPLLTRFSGKQVKFPVPIDIDGSLQHVTSLIEQGAFRAVIDRYYSMEQIREAYHYVMSGQKTGNVILQVQAE